MLSYISLKVYTNFGTLPDNGIYDLAYANAKKVITNFVHSFKEYKDCNIEVREAN